MLYQLRKAFHQKVKLIFRNEYCLGFTGNDQYAMIDPNRFRKIRNSLHENRLAKFREFIKPPMISYDQLELVHTKEYLSRVKDPVSLGRELGLSYLEPWDDHYINYYRAMTGGTVFGLQQALKEPKKPVFNFGGGFHHAHADKAEGFCLLNDTVMAIRCARKKKPDLKVLIVDLDYHQGNGNLILLRDDKLSFTFSMHALAWAEIEKNENMEILLPENCEDEAYITTLKQKLPEAFAAFQPEAVIYIAGADPFAEDTLCDFKITEEGMLERDMFVYQESTKRNLPFLVLAAGGYGPHSWKPYYNFIKNTILRNNS